MKKFKGHFYQLSSISTIIILISFYLMFISVTGDLPFVAGLSLLSVAVITLILSPKPFLFSPWFWFLIGFTFYFIFKFLFLFYQGLWNQYHEKVLSLGLFFLISTFLFYVAAELLRDKIRWKKWFRLDLYVPKYPFLVNSWVFSVLILVCITILKFILINTLGGGATYLEKLQNTQNGGVTYVFWLLDLLYVIPFVLLLRKAQLSKRLNKGCYLLMFTILVIDLVNFNRGAFVIHLLSFIFVYDSYIKRINLLNLFFVFWLLLLVVIVFGVARSDLTGTVSVLSAIEKLSDNIELISTLFFSRLDAIDNAAMYLSSWDQNLLYGKSLVSSITHAVPRAIWPEKPLLTAALVTSITHPNEFADGVNLYPTIVIEGIINFGMYGLFIYSLIFAVFLSSLQALYRADCYKVKIVYMLLMTSSMNIFNEGFHSNAFSSFLFNFVLISVFVFLTHKKSRVI